ncbi:MAG: hypothetical protein H6733_01615 [Alphaproteobacteria bacterium]|nr:hypothetical protein [Alphaproteobacteria bacterium]
MLASTRGTTRGACPAPLGGHCLDIEAPVMLLGSRAVTETGIVEMAVRVPSTLSTRLSVDFEVAFIRGYNGAASASSNAEHAVTVVPVPGCTEAGDPNYDPRANLDDGSCIGAWPSGWIPFDFTSVDWKNGCLGGDKYVRPSGYTGATWVGVQLCSPTRYKVFLSDDLNGTFTTIGDGCGSGQDQCEYVSGSHVAYDVDYATTNAGQPGWSRCSEGEEALFGTLGGAHWTPSWHECGIAIPTDVPGCTVTAATNFDPDATYDDGSCTYPSSLPDWTAIPADVPTWKNDCLGGEVYVRNSGYVSPAFVAVQLCSATRYTIFLGDDPAGPFHLLGDACGSGQDQCEFVGGAWAAYDVDYATSNAGQAGYTRCSEGDTPVFGVLGGAHWMPSWIECGVSVP